MIWVVEWPTAILVDKICVKYIKFYMLNYQKTRKHIVQREIFKKLISNLGKTVGTGGTNKLKSPYIFQHGIYPQQSG